MKEKEAFLLALERKAEIIIESAVVINQRILQEEKGKVSSAYYYSFTDLDFLNIFDEKTLEKISSTAGFRNRLAHDYENIDTGAFLKSINLLLKYYPLYLKGIEEYLKSKLK